MAKNNGMAILMVDYKGDRLQSIVAAVSFVKSKIRRGFEKYCEKCDSRGGAEAVRENKPYIYKCCFGMVDVAIPIVFQRDIFRCCDDWSGKDGL